MKKRKVFALLLTGALSVSMGLNVFAATEDEIASVQAEKQQAEAGLAQTQANISSLESEKQELENYLYELNLQYEELTESIAQLGIQAAEKEDELKLIKEELKKAKKAALNQYDAMKIRIVYMYENGGASVLERLLSCESIADFLNQVENVSQISQYDRNMLKKYEEIRKNIKEQQEQVKEESQEIDDLLAERAEKQQEVQALVASTNDSISSYVSQINASEAEASALLAQINSADNSLVALYQQAQEEQAAAERAEAEAAQEVQEEQEEQEQDYGYDPETDTTESSSSSTSSDIIVEEEAPEDYYGNTEEAEETEENYESTDSTDSTESSSSSSSEGTYLGNFVLTAYCNCAQCCGTAGNATASGVMPTAGHTVAMAGVPFGTQLLINGTVYTVEDLGTPYGHVDIYFDNHEDALSFGLQYADVYQLN